MPIKPDFPKALLLLVCGIALSSCESLQNTRASSPDYGPTYSASVEGSKDITLPSSRVDEEKRAQEQAKLANEIDRRMGISGSQSADAVAKSNWMHQGTGRFIKDINEGAKPQEPGKSAAKGDITLNFENTDIREVVKVILGDTLNLSYVLDPGVRGGVTMQTGAPIARDDLLPTLETLLRMNGASLVNLDGQYHVVPIAKAFKGMVTPQLANAHTPLPQGHKVMIRPLENIGAEEMDEILKPLVEDNSIVRVDPKRNLIVLSGTPRDMEYMLDVVNTFDVNWIKGLSVGFFALKNADVNEVQKDLDAILGGDAGEAMGGVVRISPVESANGFLVVSPSQSYLKEIGGWIERLDAMGAITGSEERMYVYRVRNSKAEDLADLLSQLFGTSGASKRTPAAEVAPGQTATTATSNTRKSTTSLSKKSTSSMGSKSSLGSNSKSKTKSTRSGGSSSVTASGGGLEGEVRVVADENHNTLLIMAVPRDYERILITLEQLDVVPLQVHVEATIVEVLLKDELQYGLQWFFKGDAGKYGTGGGLGSSAVSDGPFTDIKSLANGFNWSMVDSSGVVRAVLNAFANDSLVNVLSAPSVMVLDNHEASIQVGDEVPTISSSQGTDGGNVIQNVQYRDTGIILNVRPRVNPGGLVTMEVSQEVSAVADTNIDIQSPTIQTRKVESTVAVQSGQTVVLGGLIRDKRSGADGGIPGLYKLPFVGPLFGATQKSADRTELVVVLTPRVVTNAQDAQKVTDDFRVKLQGLKDEFLREAGVIRSAPAPTLAPNP